MNSRRLVLAARTVAVTYRAALRHRPTEKAYWFDRVRDRADRYLDDVERRAGADGPMDADVAREIRLARDRVQAADDEARGIAGVTSHGLAEDPE